MSMSRTWILTALAVAGVPAPGALAEVMEPVVVTATRTVVPLTCSEARFTQAGLTHTAAKWCSTASEHSRSMSDAEASGFRRV